jgi:hypothetical protein
MHPRISHRNPPCKFLSSFFCNCILQAAIDFAEVRSEAELEAWPALHISLSFSCGYIATHHAAFSTCILQGAIDFAERRKRSWSSGANGVAECRTLFGVAGFACTKIGKLLYPFMHSNFRQASFKSCRQFARFLKQRCARSISKRRT